MKFGDSRWFALAALVFALAPPAPAAKLTDLEHTQIEVPRPADVPSDRVMEAAGAVVGKIDIEIKNIFDESDPRENTGLYRLANHLHLRTKHKAIQAQLLFKSGEPYSGRLLAETERNLRLLLYVYDAHVIPVHFADGKVDVKVVTKDVWTLSPGISFGRAGGTNATSYNLQDTNFLGWGKTVEVARTSNVDRTSKIIEYSDPNVMWSKWTAALAYVDSSDGHQRSLLAGAALLLARNALEREHHGAQLRSNRFPLQPRQHRRSIQRQSDDLRRERRHIRRPGERLGQAAAVRDALR